MTYRKVTIMGVGLIGGSIGIDLKEKKIADEVWGWGRNIEHLKIGIQRGTCDKVTTDIKEALDEAEIIILATPPEIIKSQLKSIKPYLKKKMLIMDVGSTKFSILETAQREGVFDTGAEFLGCHPMTGSEKTGAKNAAGNIFKSSPCILTPVSKNTEQGIQEGKKFWNMLGAKVIILEPAAHDLIIGFISHLPHVLSSVLIKSSVEKLDNFDTISDISGPSFRQFTRIAGSSSDLWAQIFMENRNQVLLAIETFQKELKIFEKLIKGNNKENLEGFLNRAAEYKNKIWPAE